MKGMDINKLGRASIKVPRKEADADGSAASLFLGGDLIVKTL